MRQKNSIFRWFRRRVIPAIETNNVEKDNIKKQDEHNNEDSTKNTNTSPIPFLIDDKIKDNERSLPPKKNERITIIKPTRPVGIDLKNESPKEENKEEKEVIKEKEITSQLVQEDIIANDNVIKTDALDEIEKMLKNNYHEIQSIKYELEILEKKEQDEIILEETEKLIEELKQLIKRFEQIKKDFYKTNIEDLYIHSHDDSYIGQLIEEYKNSIKNNSSIDDALENIKQIEEYITLINEIIEIETKKDNINQKLDSKKENLELRDKEFEDLKDKFVDVEKINNYIESFSVEYDHIIKNINSKVESATNIIKKAEYKSEVAINYTKLLTSTLLLASTPAIPFTKGGNILKMGLMMASIAGISSAIKVRTKESKVITNVSFIDYQKEIQSSLNNVQDISLMIDKTILDIKDIKDEFKKEFSEYINLIPEYYELLANLDSIEKDLLVKQSITKEYDKKLGTTLEQNNIKVKRLEEEISN